MNLTSKLQLIASVSIIASVYKLLTTKKINVFLPVKQLLPNSCFCFSAEVFTLKNSSAKSAILQFVNCDHKKLRRQLRQRLQGSFCIKNVSYREFVVLSAVA